MSPDTAEFAVVEAAPGRAGYGAATATAPAPVRSRRRIAMPRVLRRFPAEAWLARLTQPRGLCAPDLRSVDPARMVAVRESWRALWVSRLLVWVAGAGTVATLGFGPIRGAFDPPGVTRGFGWLGDLLVAPAARWDSAWYLVIAHYGYRPELGSYTAARDAFFPLYPFGLHALSDLGLQAVLAGVLFSLAAFAMALYALHRLTTLELAGSGRAGSGDIAGLAVLVTALAPMAFYFSAVYSESLYLALSVGLFLCARRGRWAWAGVLGALAVATRSTGLVLALPALMLYLYGPRADRPPDFDRGRSSLPPGEGRAHAIHALGRRLRVAGPRYRPRADVLWLALLPAGLGLYMVYLWLAGGDTLAPFHAQGVWGRHFAGPYVGVWDGMRAAFEGARQLLSGQRAHVYYPAATGSPFVSAGHNLMLLAFLLAAVPLLVLALRVLPLAYGVYAIVALALPLSYPVAAQPLMSLPRFLVVLFPLSMALAVWLAAHPRARIPALATSSVSMAFFVAQFATWHWVA
ncbi:MAG TPA: mannosyltransferase family protein [Solirubrobacteraceae bacterium]|nr:mannosyltransferase family protein [Solirubrobacteraceae bacterium]